MAISSLAENLPSHEVEELLPGEVLRLPDGILHGSSWHRLREGRGGPHYHRLQTQP